jgi:hypothetical protein
MEVEKEFGGERIKLQPGQLITGRKKISSTLKVSESKVQRILKRFEIEQQIEQQSSNKNRLISILGWDKYQHVEQQNEQPVNNNRTTTEQQVNTNKNLRTKELKNLFVLLTDKTTTLGFGETIYLTKNEYDYLVDQFGEEDARRMIFDLDRHKESTGERFESDFKAIIDRTRDEMQS